jgi:leucyl-tRNA synthetase
VLSPEHPIVLEIASESQKEVVLAYIDECSKKSEMERLDNTKEKTGVFTGAYAVNPVNGKEIPIYIADYVLISYGTGAIMAVPAHDERDYAFAKKFGIQIIPVLDGKDVSEEAHTGDGLHINSGFLDGLNKADAINKMASWLEEQGIGKKTTNYRLREWVFASQRYWGEPVPVAFYDDGTPVAIEELPVTLPELTDYKGKNGKAPLDNATEWKNITINGRHATREVNTMPGSAGSSWYFLRYIDPHNDNALADYELLKHWMPVDLYIGGTEHAVGHLLYSRFWNNYLYDKGVVPTKEPFKKLCHQGMILGENGEKMSKSRGNVINPNDIVDEYGADTLRLYEMFMGPLQDAKPWNTKNIEGSRKFIERVWRLVVDEERISNEDNSNLVQIYHQTVKKVTEDYEKMNFNTAISQMMIFVNAAYKEISVPRYMAEGLVKLINPICPFFTEELWQNVFGYSESIAHSEWPKYDEAKLISDTYTLVVQVNGKLRDRIEVSQDATQDEIKKIALESEKVLAHTNGLTVVKVIVVPKKLVNIVVK